MLPAFPSDFPAQSVQSLRSEVLATQQTTDVAANFQQHWDHFVGTGQSWALLIGLIVGYLVRMFTSYG